MISLHVFFWFMVILFGIIGMMRGWAKELLVLFSVVLGLFVITVLDEYAEFVRDLLTGGAEPAALFWLRFVVLTALVFFGYQGPNISKFAATNKLNREKFQDSLLGIFLGALNGYFIFGSLLYYLDKTFIAAETKYAVLNNILIAPDPLSETGIALSNLIEWLPPSIIGIPAIYFVVAFAFAFVLVVFL